MDLGYIISSVEKILSAIIFLINLIIYVFLMGRVFPKLFLKVKSNKNSLGDRGLKKYVFKGGRGIVYSTIPAYHNYVNKYLLYEKDGIKYVKCNVLKNVSKIKYQIHMFDSDANLIDSIEVLENLISPCHTSNIKVNEKTAYVRLIIKSINGKAFDLTKVTHIKRSKIILYDIVSLSVTVFEAFVIKLALFKGMQILGLTTLVPLRISNLAVVICGVIVAFIYTRITLSYYKKKGVRLR